MPVGGKLVLKGGLQVKATGVEKKKKKKKHKAEEMTEEQKKQQEEALKAAGISVMGGKNYEDTFALEMEKAKQGKAKVTPWGSGYARAPEILHGYSKKVKGKTAEERLDMRAAMKTDKFCNGKSTAAAAVAQACRDLGQDVVVVDEDSLHLRRNDSYKDATAEKQARGAMLSAIDRCLTRRRTVVFDTQNNIKGYRYQLWCIARTVGTRFCMLHVDTPPDTCRQWNAAREADSSYSEPIFEDLACRFERPDSRNRWDSPLFMVQPLLGEAALQEVAATAAAAVADGPPPARRAAAGAADNAGAAPAAAAAAARAAGGLDAAAAAAAAAAGLPPEEAVVEEGPALVLRAKELRPHLATDTSHYKLASTNLQHDIDQALQRVLEAVSAAQAAAGSSAAGVVCFESGGSSSGLPTLDMYRPMFLPELRRHKRSFMKLATHQTFSRLSDAAAAQRLFIGYLRDQLGAAQH